MESVYDDHIALSSGRDEENHWRLPRLQRVIGYTCALADQATDKGVLDKVGGLHDHKGVLTVKWKAEPTAQQKEYFLKAWASAIGDGGDNVQHETY